MKTILITGVWSGLGAIAQAALLCGHCTVGTLCDEAARRAVEATAALWRRSRSKALRQQFEVDVFAPQR